MPDECNIRFLVHGYSWGKYYCYWHNAGTQQQQQYACVCVEYQIHTRYSSYVLLENGVRSVVLIIGNRMQRELVPRSSPFHFEMVKDSTASSNKMYSSAS